MVPSDATHFPRKGYTVSVHYVGKKQTIQFLIQAMRGTRPSSARSGLDNSSEVGKRFSPR
ncbi:unnamed protein product [Ectocarpus sp. CCAP 1310/34]|nr:unnamed protein product [Ectocarpus sp. CCAP 1310/34]